jgi:hypothetical protein
LFEQAKSYAYAYMDGVFDRNVFPAEAALANLKSFDEPLPPMPGDPSDMLRMLHEYGSPATVAHTGGSYFGLVRRRPMARYTCHTGQRLFLGHHGRRYQPDRNSFR